MTQTSKPSLELEQQEKTPDKQFCPICGHVQYTLTECERCGQSMIVKKSHKKSIAALILLLILLASTLFLLRNKDGKFIIFRDSNNQLQLDSPDWSKTIQGVDKLIDKSTEKNTGKVSVYKWQDKNGIWHYSQTLPEQGNMQTEASTIEVNLDTNIVPTKNELKQ